jgi:nitrate reductase gamma subunit
MENMKEDKPPLTLLEAINLVGSIASTTGVTLLWLKDRFDTRVLFYQIPIMALWAAFLLAAAVGGYYAIFLFGEFFRNESPSARRAAMVFMFPFVALFFYGFLLISFHVAKLAVDGLGKQ